MGTKIVYSNAQRTGLVFFTKHTGIVGDTIMYWQKGKECTHSAISYFDLEQKMFKVSEQKFNGNVTTPIDKWLKENYQHVQEIAYPNSAVFANELKNSNFAYGIEKFEHIINTMATDDRIHGVDYDFGGLFYYAWEKFIKLNDPTSYYCSEQVGTYYKTAGFEFIPKIRPSRQSPCMQYRQIGSRFDSVKDEIIKLKG